MHLKRRLALTLTCLGFALFVPSVFSAQETGDEKTLTEKQAAYRVTLHLKRQQFGHLEEIMSRWGGYEKRPVYTITRIEVYRDKKRIYLPYSSFGDLLDPYRVTLKSTKHTCRITIDGADAASSYHAFLQIKDGQLTERQVEAGEAGDLTWEKSVYKNLPAYAPENFK